MRTYAAHFTSSTRVPTEHAVNTSRLWQTVDLRLNAQAGTACKQHWTSLQLTISNSEEGNPTDVVRQPQLLRQKLQWRHKEVVSLCIPVVQHTQVGTCRLMQSLRCVWSHFQGYNKI